MNTAPVTGVYTQLNNHKKAICKFCLNKLIEGETIVSISRLQGKFYSTSNYHILCAEPILKNIMDETAELMRNLIDVSEKVTLLL
jgi:hypothetical protein